MFSLKGTQNLKINCSFLTQVWYVGHLISEQWLHVDTNRLCGILNFSKSKIQHQFKIFLNLNVGQEATVKKLYGNTDWFRIEKEVQQCCLLSPCIFNLAHHEKCRAVWVKLDSYFYISSPNIYLFLQLCKCIHHWILSCHSTNRYFLNTISIASQRICYCRYSSKRRKLGLL